MTGARRAPRKRPTPEADFQEAVIRRTGDHADVYVVRLAPERFNQRGQGNTGFPDLMFVGPGGLMFRELKTEDGKARGLRSTQTTWKWRLKAARQDWAVWTPADLASGRVDAELAALGVPLDDDPDAEFARVMARD
jgi:hypothetical protein